MCSHKISRWKTYFSPSSSIPKLLSILNCRCVCSQRLIKLSGQTITTLKAAPLDLILKLKKCPELPKKCTHLIASVSLCGSFDVPRSGSLTTKWRREEGASFYRAPGDGFPAGTLPTRTLPTRQQVSVDCTIGIARVASTPRNQPMTINISWAL